MKPGEAEHGGPALMAGCPEAWHEEREREGGRVCGALVTLESPENRKIFSETSLSHEMSRCCSCTVKFPHGRPTQWHNCSRVFVFAAVPFFIGSTTILSLRKIKIHLWNKSFLFFSILCLKLMFVIVPVKSRHRPISFALVKEGMSPHLYKQS